MSEYYWKENNQILIDSNEYDKLTPISSGEQFFIGRNEPTERKNIICDKLDNIIYPFDLCVCPNRVFLNKLYQLFMISLFILAGAFFLVYLIINYYLKI